MWDTSSTGTNNTNAWSTGGTIYIQWNYVPPPVPVRPQINAFEVLGLPPTGAPKIEVKRAYRKLAKQFHPDLGGDVDKMALVNGAYEFLKARGLA